MRDVIETGIPGRKCEDLPIMVIAVSLFTLDLSIEGLSSGSRSPSKTSHKFDVSLMYSYTGSIGDAANFGFDTITSKRLISMMSVQLAKRQLKKR